MMSDEIGFKLLVSTLNEYKIRIEYLEQNMQIAFDHEISTVKSCQTIADILKQQMDRINQLEGKLFVKEHTK